MNCKKCGAELVEGQPFCPACGTDNRETPEVTEIPVEQETRYTGPEIVEEKKKMSAGKIIGIVAIVLVLLAVLVSVVVISMKSSGDGSGDSTTTEATEADPTIPADGNPDDETCKGTYTVTDAEALAQHANVVATFGGKELTNGQLNMEYWMSVYNFLSYYGSYIDYFGLDYTQPLDVQAYSDGYTWQHMFLAQALDSWHQYAALAAAAEQAGFVLDEESREYLDDLPTTLEETAIENGYENAEALIQADMGPGCTLEDYLAYMEMYYTGYMYYLHAADSLTATDDELSAYYEENKEELDGLLEDYEITSADQTVYSVRHVLIGVEEDTDEGWAACLKEAQDLLDQWVADGASESDFASMASEYSEDTGSSSNGGLYTMLTSETNFVENFKNWYLDESRQYGDYGIVQSSYGYHIMFFSDVDVAWHACAEEELLSEKLTQLIEDAMAAHELEVNYSDIALGYVSLVSES